MGSKNKPKNTTCVTSGKIPKECSQACKKIPDLYDQRALWRCMLFNGDNTIMDRACIGQYEKRMRECNACLEEHRKCRKYFRMLKVEKNKSKV